MKVEAGERFAFGKNWRRFLELLDEDRIRASEEALENMLGKGALQGKTFLDIGSGSGLSSLAARRLGSRVHSFDNDPESVACTREVRARYFPEDEDWRVEEGSALDRAYLSSLGSFDIVYSWGVLHHTGSMWQALDLVARNVARGGTLFISIYNDQGAWSVRWSRIKRFYCSGAFGRWLVTSTFVPWFFLRALAADVFWMRNPLARYRRSGTGKGRRGMSIYLDLVDWLGGYPFEVARPEEIFEFCKKRGFRLERLTTAGGSIGCNEFVFRCGD